eukprot:COSAG05_NODE_833_length_7066_cov_45.021961_8_plen_162_part_00
MGVPLHVLSCRWLRPSLEVLRWAVVLVQQPALSCTLSRTYDARGRSLHNVKKNCWASRAHPRSSAASTSVASSKGASVPKTKLLPQVEFTGGSTPLRVVCVWSDASWWQRLCDYAWHTAREAEAFAVARRGGSGQQHLLLLEDCSVLDYSRVAMTRLAYSL